jgi:pimeloyl-ACP methyl ester carboxylesterase
LKPHQVLRRTVFYIAGFDPRGPLHYHRLYSTEAAKQAVVNGAAMTVSKRRNEGALQSKWTVKAAGTTSDIRFLRYEDIVRRQWPRNAFDMYGGILRYSWHFLRMGVFGRIWQNSWPGFVAVIYPLALLVVLFLLAALLGLGVASVLRPWTGGWSYLALVAALTLPFAIYRLLEVWLNGFWLARSCTFLVDRALGQVPGIEERCSEFAAVVAETVSKGECDEVLVVGHSVGTHVAVTVAARTLERIGPEKRFSLLTLGHAMVMTPDEPTARQFRTDLLALSASEQVDWIDVTSAVDGACIALSDPLMLSGVTRPPGSRQQPKLVSARFNKLFSAATYKAIRRNFLRTHFQYLMAAELPGEYDYFLITAGDLTLAERFAHLESVTGFNRFRMGKT